MGYKWQGLKDDFEKAKKIVSSWGADGKIYEPTAAYQLQLRELTSRFQYRLDTNFAKMDRIAHKELEEFKNRVLGTQVNGMSVGEWSRLLSQGDEPKIKIVLETHLGIRDQDAEEELID